MWKVMAECHQTQKRILDEANILLPRKHSSISLPDPHRLARSASSLETELKNWRATFESWIASQRSYVQALTDWLLRCTRSDAPDASPRPSSGTHPIFGLCVQWSRRLDAIDETSVLDGIEFFTASVRSLCAQEVREDSRRNVGGSKESGGKMKVVEVGDVVEEQVRTAEKMGEDGIRVICEGMLVATSSLAQFAIDSTKGYDELVEQWENVKWEHASIGASA